MFKVVFEFPDEEAVASFLSWFFWAGNQNYLNWTESTNPVCFDLTELPALDAIPESYTITGETN